MDFELQKFNSDKIKIIDYIKDTFIRETRFTVTDIRRNFQPQ